MHANMHANPKITTTDDEASLNSLTKLLDFYFRKDNSIKLNYSGYILLIMTSARAMYEKLLKIENKDILVDLHQNSDGLYVKLSERQVKSKGAVLIPASGIEKLVTVFAEVISARNAVNQNSFAVKESADASTMSVFVSGLAWTTTEATLDTHFGPNFPNVNSVINRKQRGNKLVSLGSAIVDFATAAEAERAIAVLNGSTLEGRVIKCRLDRKCLSGANGTDDSKVVTTVTAASAEAQDIPRVLEPNKVFVTSLSWATTAETLSTVFAEAGTVVSSVVLCSKKGRSLGHGIVEFSNSAGAQNAIADFSNKRELDGRVMTVRGYYAV